MPLFKQSPFKKTAKGVSFKETIIDGVSQPVTESEDDALYWFNEHAEDCDYCYRPIKVLRKGGHFCAEGLRKAKRVVDLFLELDNGVVYRHDQQTQQYIRVEVPRKYKNTLQLLQVLQHSGSSFLQPSLDRKYDVRPRVDNHQRYEVKPSYAPVEDYNQSIAEPKSSRVKSNRKKPRYQSGRDSRGSLMDNDLLEQDQFEQRESKLYYDPIEPILPHWWHQSYYPQHYQHYNYANPYSYGTT